MNRSLALPLFAAAIIPLFGLFAAIPSLAAPGGNSALATLRAFGQKRSQADVARVVGVVGFHGQDQPDQWLILQADPLVPNLLHEYAMRQGNIVAQRQFRRDPQQDLPSIPIVMSRIAVDSTRAFQLADQNARKAGVGFDAIHYQLRCRDLRNEPIWVLNLVDGTQRSVGALYISAVTGETLRSVWYVPGGTTSTTAPPPSIAVRETPKGLIPKIVSRMREDDAVAAQPPPPPGFSAPPVPPRSPR